MGSGDLRDDLEIMPVIFNFWGMLSGIVQLAANKEEYITKMNESVPLLLETKIRQLGARFEDAEPWSEHVCVDKNIITGQNPQSSLLLSEKMVEALS